VISKLFAHSSIDHYLVGRMKRERVVVGRFTLGERTVVDTGDEREPHAESPPDLAVSV
jgi:hypothetical protein